MKINRLKINGQSMRYLVCAVFMCLAFFVFSGYVYADEDYEVTEMQMQGTITSDTSLNVRSGPGTDYSVITKVDKDTVLMITGQTDNGWYQVEVDGQTGFVSGEYVDAVQMQAEGNEEPEKEAGEPEEGYRGLHQSPFVMKTAAIGAVIVVVLVMLVLTLKGIRKDRDDGDDDEDDEDEDDEDDDEDESDDDDGDDEDDDGDGEDNSDGDEEETEDGEEIRARRRKKRASERPAGGSGKKKGRKAYVLREEDYRVQIDPSFFEDREPIEQPAMVTGYLERKKIEEAEARARAQEESEGKQKELDAAMAKLSELQKEIERLKSQE